MPGVLRHRHQQLAEVARRVPLERVDLHEHLAVVAHLVLGGGEVSVPEERHLLLERPVGVEHPLGPPVADPAGLEPARAQPVEEPVGDRLSVPVDVVGLDPHPHALPVPHPQLGGGGAARRKIEQPLVPEPGVLERRQVVVGDLVVVDEGADRLLGGHLGELPDVLRGAAEARTAQQVLGAVEAPVRLGDRGQVPPPFGRPRLPGLRLRRHGAAGEAEREHGRNRRGKVVSSRHGMFPLLCSQPVKAVQNLHCGRPACIVKAWPAPASAWRAPNGANGCAACGIECPRPCPQGSCEPGAGRTRPCECPATSIAAGTQSSARSVPWSSLPASSDDCHSPYPVRSSLGAHARLSDRALSEPLRCSGFDVRRWAAGFPT